MKRADLDAAEAIALRLEGIAAKLHVMAGAFQQGAEAPENTVTETALISIADEVAAAQEDLLTVLQEAKQ